MYNLVRSPLLREGDRNYQDEVSRFEGEPDWERSKTLKEFG